MFPLKAESFRHGLVSIVYDMGENFRGVGCEGRRLRGKGG